MNQKLISSLMNVVALTEESSWFARHTDILQSPLGTISPERLQQFDIAVISPEKNGDNRPNEIIQWKKEGLLPRTKLCFGSYKGIHYWNPPTEDWVERWVVHCKSEIIRTGSDRLTFVPLSYDGTLTDRAGQYVFCGGRKDRDFRLAIYAVLATGFKSYFVSDFLPAIVAPNISSLRMRVPLETYKKFIEDAWITLVPVKPGLKSHGHSDVVRSLVAGRPVIVTKGGSCDDYVVDGVNGYLVPYEPRAWVAALSKAWFKREQLTAGAKASALKLSSECYNQAIRTMLMSLSRP